MDNHHGVADRSQRAGESGGGSGAVENWVSSATVPTAAVPVNNFGWEKRGLRCEAGRDQASPCSPEAAYGPMSWLARGPRVYDLLELYAGPQ